MSMSFALALTKCASARSCIAALTIVCFAGSFVRAQTQGEQGSSTSTPSQPPATRADTSPASFEDPHQCSTEKVNHDNCDVIIDRRYPLTLPTIQMAPGTVVTVKIQDRLAFERLSLDETGATALPASDQGAALLTAAIPDLKGFVWSNVTVPQQFFITKVPTDACDKTRSGYKEEACKAQQAEEARVKTVTDILNVMGGLLDSAKQSIPTDPGPFFKHVRIVYSQLNQILSPIPKPGSRPGDTFNPPSIEPNTPNPWTDYKEWRRWLICELVGEGNGVSCRTGSDPQFTNLLGDIGAYQKRLPVTPPATQADNAFFDQATFDGLATRAKKVIQGLDPSDRTTPQRTLDDLQQQENNLNAYLAVLTATLMSVQKDFLTYYQNIYLAEDHLPEAKEDKAHDRIPELYELGKIGDPRDKKANRHLVAYSKLFGRQVVFNVNVVNNIATPLDSVTTSAAKTAITTITVLYADPIFETSAGVIFSFVHNRTFTNQLITTPPPGSNYVAGDMVVYENKTTPEIVPFVAAHWRVLPDIAPAWLGHRRAAFYGTIWLGLNPYLTVPEYGAGPTFSWRAFMFSALYSRAHETVLKPPAKVGQIVCGPPATLGTSPPSCNPTPPAPTTVTNSINAFAIGLSVRIPTSFASGTGGISR